MVRAALEELPYDFVAAHVVGGTEKLREDADYGVAVASDLERALSSTGRRSSSIFSDEPVLAQRRLPRAACSRRGCRTWAPTSASTCPSRAVPAAVDRDHRHGKAGRQDVEITAHAATLYARDRRVVVLAMGRGGPPEPEVATVAPDLDALLALSRAGRHAALITFETAALAGVETIGCRRCAASPPALSPSRTCTREPGWRSTSRLDLVVLDGSGAAIPPVATGRRVLVVNCAWIPTSCSAT